jgi:peptidoglycan-associated lipoprotein
MTRLRIVFFVLVLGGCAAATTTRAPVDVAGRWTGTWLGYGVAVGPREDDVTLDLVQAGTTGKGQLLMSGTLAADSVPDRVRDSGMARVRLVFDVSGNQIRLRHELGADLFEAEMIVLGDRMVGRALRADPPVRFDLVRERPQAASVAVAFAPPPAAPPPPAVGVPPARPLAEVPGGPAPSPEAPRRDAPAPTEFSATPEVRTIHFDFDRSEIRPGDAAILDASAEWLRAHPQALVLIEGHGDERGTAEYNLALGERRARSTMTYLRGRGVADTRITITSYGFEHPLCTEHTEACWSRNRRAVLLVKPK